MKQGEESRCDPSVSSLVPSRPCAQPGWVGCRDMLKPEAVGYDVIRQHGCVLCFVWNHSGDD